jgi:hypothetical protein
VDGFQFEPGNSAQLATLVRWLLRDADFRAELAAGALSFARTRTWEANLDGLLDKYAAVAATRDRRLVAAS